MFAAFLSIRVSKNCRIILDETLLDRVAKELAFVDFFPIFLCDRLTGSKFILLFYNEEHCTRHVQVKNTYDT